MPLLAERASLGQGTMGSTSCPGLLSLNSSCPEFSSHIPQSSCFACLPTAFLVVCSEAELCLLSPSSFSNCLGYFWLLPWVLGEHQVARSTLGCQSEHLQWPEPHLGNLSTLATASWPAYCRSSGLPGCWVCLQAERQQRLIFKTIAHK